MRSTRAVLLTLIALFPAPLLYGQVRSKFEIYGGYSYVHGLSSGSVGINGAEGAASWNFNHRLGVDFDVSGYHGSMEGATGGAYFYLGGPRLNFGPIFVHGLVGGEHTTISVRGSTASNDSLATAFGCGHQWKMAKNISLRTSADYVLTNYGGSIQNNIRVSIGVVFGFGHITHRGSGRRSRPLLQGNQSSPLLGVTGHPHRGGFEIVSVDRGSIASRIGLVPRDVILKINDTPVNSGPGIEKSMGESSSKDTLEYLIQGNWAVQKSF
jgi:hypothetical protein